MKATGAPDTSLHAFPNPDRPHTEPGMQLRDWFAGQVLAMLCRDSWPVDAAREAYEYADAMLRHRGEAREPR